jgi:prepilin-type N-terminal cleavage/methylation domain-containing protein
MARRHTRQAGFTMLELLIVIAMIAVLAAIALPSYWGTSRKSKADAEVGPLFNDLHSRMQQFSLENGLYPATLGEGTLCPATPGTTKQDLYACANYNTAWRDGLKMRLSGSNEVYCGYTWVSGLAGDASNIGAVAAAAPFNFTVPETNWYYLFARCNLDGDAAVDAFAFSSSVDPTIMWLNRGK